MPQILTKYFESFEYQEDDVVEFPSGLPAFENETRFLIIERAATAPLAFLQSLGQPDLCFLALPVLAIDPNYESAVTREDLQTLGLELNRQPRIGAEIGCLAILVVTENGRTSANLSAPVVINRTNRIGLQAIRADSVYSHQHPVTIQEEVCS